MAKHDYWQVASNTVVFNVIGIVSPVFSVIKGGWLENPRGRFPMEVFQWETHLQMVDFQLPRLIAGAYPLVN